MELVKPYVEKLSLYKFECVFILISLFMTILSLATHVKGQNNEAYTPPSSMYEQKINQSLRIIHVDVSGSVEKPDVYELHENARMKDALLAAGGITTDADKNFYGRNFNLSQILTDQEKIYIPSVYEVENGTYVERSKLVEPKVNTSTNIKPQSKNIASKVNINQSSAEELQKFLGISKTTANKIIDAKPYSSISSLIDKKVISKSIYDKIVGLIEL